MPWLPREELMGWSDVHQRKAWDSCGLVRIVHHMPAEWCARAVCGEARTLEVFYATRSLVEVVCGQSGVECENASTVLDPPPHGAFLTGEDVSAILWLTDHVTEGEVDFLIEGLPRIRHYPTAGDLILFKGKVIKHCCAPVTSRTRVEARFGFKTRYPVDK